MSLVSPQRMKINLRDRRRERRGGDKNSIAEVRIFKDDILFPLLTPECLGKFSLRLRVSAVHY